MNLLEFLRSEVTKGRERSSKVKVQNSKNFISELSWIYTYIKCIIHKLSKKRVRPSFGAYFVPNFRHNRHIHKMCILF